MNLSLLREAQATLHIEVSFVYNWYLITWTGWDHLKRKYNIKTNGKVTQW